MRTPLPGERDDSRRPIRFCCGRRQVLVGGQRLTSGNGEMEKGTDAGSQEDAAAAPAPASELEIVFHDDDIAVLNKPSALRTVPGKAVGPEAETRAHVRLGCCVPIYVSVCHALYSNTLSMLTFMRHCQTRARLKQLWLRQLRGHGRGFGVADAVRCGGWFVLHTRHFVGGSSHWQVDSFTANNCCFIASSVWTHSERFLCENSCSLRGTNIRTCETGHRCTRVYDDDIWIVSHNRLLCTNCLCSGCACASQVEWHSGTKRQRQEFWTDVVHDACQSLLESGETEGEEEFRNHLRRLTRENNVPRKRRERTCLFVHTDRVGEN